MRLVHYSSEPFPALQEIEHGGGWREDFYKPHGLWVSDDDANYDWRDWCIDNDFNLSGLTHVHDVTLAPDANVLTIRDATGIRWITQHFRDLDQHNDLGRALHAYGLNWAAIREHWDGLIITPYLWECRLEPWCMWYYAWDCASGCIWHKRAIASISLREMVAAPKPRRYDTEDEA